MASDIFSQLIAAFWKLFALFYERRAVSEGLCEQNMIAVQIKYASNRESIILTLNKDWTVADVKRRVVDEINKQRNETKLSEQEIAIIFAGRELNDCVAMNECDLGNNSILHAVKIKNKANMNATSTNGTNTLTEAVISLSLVDHQLTSQTEHKHENHSTTGSREKRTYFFVFCSSCKDIKSGKLRVRCAKCKENSLVVARDPVCWNDVLSSGRITGKCHSGQCNGSIAEFYFKCSGEHLNGEAVILYLLRHNNREIPCLACTGVHEVVLVFSCAHKHVICYQCFKIYCLTKLNDRQFVIDPNIGYTLACAVGCEDSLIKETHHFRIMGEEAYNKYQRFAAEECLLQSGGVLCPQPNCGAGIFMEYDDDIDPDLCNRVVCGSCNYAFCRICSQGYHIGDCARDELLSLDSKLTLFNSSINVESAKKSKWENDAELSLKTIRSTTKPCPKCRTPVERNGGCMHMRCTRPGCGFNWCWLCQTEWTRDCMADHWFN